MFRYWRGKLDGMRSASSELAKGVSSHYEHEGEECHEYEIGLWNLGSAMGEACWQKGFDAGQQWTKPEDGEIRIDLSVEELMNVRLLAHRGFEDCMIDRDGGFENVQQAEKAPSAIEKVEFHIPRKMRQDDDPHALSFNRATMIWNRWPS
jgi:hypothetical protein